MNDSDFMAELQASLNNDYINTLKTIPKSRNEVVKSLVKSVDQLPSVSKKTYNTVIELLFQLDAYDQVSPSLYHHNVILQQIIVLLNVILSDDEDFVMNEMSGKSTMFKLKSNIRGIAKKHTFSHNECLLMFKIFNTYLLRKYCLDEKDFEYYKDINKMLTALTRVLEKGDINEIVCNCINMNVKIFAFETDDEDVDTQEQVVLNKRINNGLVNLLMSLGEVNTSLKLFLEAKIENEVMKDMVRSKVIGCEDKDFDIHKFKFMIKCKEQYQLDDMITKNIIEHKLINYIIWFNNNIPKRLKYERMSLMLEITSYVKQKRLFVDNLLNSLHLLKGSLNKYIESNEETSKSSLYKIVALVIEEISAVEEISKNIELQALNIYNYTEPDYTLWSPLWEDAILEKLSTTKDEDFVKWVNNNTNMGTDFQPIFQTEFDHYIYNKFQKQLPISVKTSDIKTFGLSKELKKRLVVHNMGMLLTTESFDIKYLINEANKTITFVVKYKFDDDSIVKEMLDLSCYDDSGLLHKLDANTVKILRVYDWDKYINGKTTMRFKILMTSGKKYVFDVEYYLYLNKLFKKDEDMTIEMFESQWKQSNTKMDAEVDTNYDKFVIYSNKMKKYDLQVLARSNDCFYLFATIQTIDSQQVNILSVVSLNNQFTWDMKVSNNSQIPHISDIINKSFIDLFTNI